jgi:hypothetical protein
MAHAAAAPGSAVVAAMARALSDAVTAANTSLKLLQTELMEVLIVAAGKKSFLDHDTAVDLVGVAEVAEVVAEEVATVSGLRLCVVGVLRALAPLPLRTQRPAGHCILDCAIRLLRTRLKCPTSTSTAATVAEEDDAGGAAVRALLLDALRNDGSVTLCSRLLPKLARLLAPQESVIIRRMRAPVVPQLRTPSSATDDHLPTQLSIETTTLHAAVMAFASRSIGSTAAEPVATDVDESKEDVFAVSAAVELIDTLRVHSAVSLLEPLFTRALHLNAVHVAEAIVRMVAGGPSLHEGDEIIQVAVEPAAEARAEGTCTATVLLQRLLEHCETTSGVRTAKRVAAKLASDLRFATGGLGLTELALPVNIITRGARMSERDAELPAVWLPSERVVLVDSVEAVEAARGGMETAAAQVRL